MMLKSNIIEEGNRTDTIILNNMSHMFYESKLTSDPNSQINWSTLVVTCENSYWRWMNGWIL